MNYSKTTDGIIRNLNGLIVQAKETADYTRKNKQAMPEAAALYSQFWDNIAARAESMADGLSQTLESITAITRYPDGISARFRIMKAIEDAAFQSRITSFEAGLTVARATAKHRAAFKPICDRYEDLSRNAQLKADKIAEFFDELSSLIFQDMRETAAQKIQDAAKKGRAAAENLSADPSLPYAYIADEILEIAGGLSSIPLKEMTVARLEDYSFRLEGIAFAADMDALRDPSHKSSFDGIAEFKNGLSAAVEFFRGLLGDISGALAETENPTLKSAKEKAYSDQTLQANILLFSLKGEMQKLEIAHLDKNRKTALQNICRNLEQAIRTAKETSHGELAEILQTTYGELDAEAEKLGPYGAPIRFIAAQIQDLS